MTCCGEIFEVQNVEMSRVTLTTTLSGRIFQQAGTCYGQHRPTLNLKSLYKVIDNEFDRVHTTFYSTF